jgi:hypothetical protein
VTELVVVVVISETAGLATALAAGCAGGTVAGAWAVAGDVCTSVIGASSELRAAGLLPGVGAATVAFAVSEAPTVRAS